MNNVKIFIKNVVLNLIKTRKKTIEKLCFSNYRTLYRHWFVSREY